MVNHFYGWLLTGVLVSVTALAAPTITGANAEIRNLSGESIGRMAITQGANGVMARIEVEKLSPGWHAIHIHEVGNCEGEGFKAAGGHANGDTHAHHLGNQHGFLTGDTRHLGDMPNIWAHKDGIAKVEYYLPDVTINALLDEDGASVIIHENADDYKTQPSGGSGARIACGVLQAG